MFLFDFAFATVVFVSFSKLHSSHMVNLTKISLVLYVRDLGCTSSCFWSRYKPCTSDCGQCWGHCSKCWFNNLLWRKRYLSNFHFLHYYLLPPKNLKCYASFFLAYISEQVCCMCKCRCVCFWMKIWQNLFHLLYKWQIAIHILRPSVSS